VLQDPFGQDRPRPIPRAEKEHVVPLHHLSATPQTQFITPRLWPPCLWKGGSQTRPLPCFRFAACELLGFDPLYLANEGKLIAIVAPNVAEELLQAMRRHPLGAGVQIIGTVTQQNAGLVTMRTPFGTTRIVDMLAGDQLPRIC
jgi:hypothetical protein